MKPKKCNYQGCDEPRAKKPGNTTLHFRFCYEHQAKEAVKKLPAFIEKQAKKERREYKEKNKSIAQLIQEARKPFQQWIRIRDANNACISCGSVDAEIWHGGHFKKAELYSGMIFDDDNVHKQCLKCNKYLDGNEGEYRKQLIKKFGHQWVSKLDLKAEARRQYKYTREELLEIKDKYTKLCRLKS